MDDVNSAEFKKYMNEVAPSSPGQVFVHVIDEVKKIHCIEDGKYDSPNYFVIKNGTNMCKNKLLGEIKACIQEIVYCSLCYKRPEIETVSANKVSLIVKIVSISEWEEIGQHQYYPF